MIKLRLIQVLEYKRIPKESFYDKIGQSSANYRGSNRVKTLNSDVIEKILTEIPDLNPVWFLTGKGDMLIDPEEAKILGNDIIKLSESAVQRIERIAKAEEIPITTLERRMGMSKGALSRSIRTGTDIGVSWISALSELYPKYDMHWLITGTGSMILKRTVAKNENFDEVQKRLLELLSQKDNEIISLKKELESFNSYTGIAAEHRPELTKK